MFPVSHFMSFSTLTTLFSISGEANVILFFTPDIFTHIYNCNILSPECSYLLKHLSIVNILSHLSSVGGVFPILIFSLNLLLSLCFWPFFFLNYLLQNLFHLIGFHRQISIKLKFSRPKFKDVY